MTPSGLLCDAVVQGAQALDLHFYDISWFHPQGWCALSTSPSGSPCRDDIATFQAGERGAVFQDGGYVEDHFPQGCVLDTLIIQACANAAGPHPAGPRKVLPRCELMSMGLPVAHAAVVVAGVSSDVIQCFGARYIAARFSYDYR